MVAVVLLLTILQITMYQRHLVQWEGCYNRNLYLGTLSNGLATTGVDGLEVIIAEAGISWYNYYRENGLVTSPGAILVKI